MKSLLIIILLSTGLASCVSIKSVEDIDGYHIIQGNKKVGKKLKNQNVFSFQIYQSENRFYQFLSDRHKDYPGFYPKKFKVIIEDVPFYLSVLGKNESDKHLDFTDVFLDVEDPEIVKSGKEKHFIYIVVKDEHEQDALSTDSFYRYIVAKYLDELRIAFNSY